MTRGFFTASVAVAAALAIGPASSGIMNPLVQRTGTSFQGTGSIATTSPATPQPLPSIAAESPAAPIASGAPTNITPRPTLSMVPRNPKLQSRLRALLPPGMTVRQAAQGFVDQSQFVSTVHVSRNLDIPFTQLKAKIVDERMSLGQAIQVLRPEANVWKELTRARDATPKELY